MDYTDYIFYMDYMDYMDYKDYMHDMDYMDELDHSNSNTKDLAKSPLENAWFLKAFFNMRFWLVFF